MKIVVNQRKYARNVVKVAVNQNKKSHAVGGVLFNNNKFTLNVNQVSEYAFEKINVFVIKPKFNFYLSIRETTQPVKEKIKIRIIKTKKEINFFYKLFLQKLFTKNILLIKKQEIIFSLFFWKVKNIFCFAKLKQEENIFVIKKIISENNFYLSIREISKKEKVKIKIVKSKKYFDFQNNKNFSYQPISLLKSLAVLIFIFSSLVFSTNFLNPQKNKNVIAGANQKSGLNQLSTFLVANSDNAVLQIAPLADNQENRQAVQTPNNIIADATQENASSQPMLSSALQDFEGTSIFQVSSIIAGLPVEHNIFIKRASINENAYLVKVPKDATNVEIKRVTQVEANEAFSYNQLRLSQGLTFEQRQDLFYFTFDNAENFESGGQSIPEQNGQYVDLSGWGVSSFVPSQPVSSLQDNEDDSTQDADQLAQSELAVDLNGGILANVDPVLSTTPSQTDILLENGLLSTITEIESAMAVDSLPDLSEQTTPSDSPVLVPSGSLDEEAEQSDDPEQIESLNQDELPFADEVSLPVIELTKEDIFSSVADVTPSENEILVQSDPSETLVSVNEESSQSEEVIPSSPLQETVLTPVLTNSNTIEESINTEITETSEISGQIQETESVEEISPIEEVAQTPPDIVLNETTPAENPEINLETSGVYGIQETVPTEEIIPVEEAIQTQEVTQNQEQTPLETALVEEVVQVEEIVQSENIAPIEEITPVVNEETVSVSEVLDSIETEGDANGGDATGVAADADVGRLLETPAVTDSIEIALTLDMPTPHTQNLPLNTDYIQITYQMPAPKIEEQDTNTGKIVTVSAPDEDEENPLTNVLAYTTITEVYKINQEDQIQIEWDNNENQNIEFKGYDLNENGYIDYIEWTVPHLSTQTFNIIFISKALLLDQDKNPILDVYNEVKAQDSAYASITNGQYLKITFENALDKSRNITIYASSHDEDQAVSIEVYPVYTDGNTGDQSVATIENIKGQAFYKAKLTNLQTPTDVFDLKIRTTSDVVQSVVNIDYIDYADFDYGPNSILTPSGYKNISFLKIGDEVVGYKNGERVVNRIENIQFVQPDAYDHFEQDADGKNTEIG